MRLRTVCLIGTLLLVWTSALSAQPRGTIPGSSAPVDPRGPGKGCKARQVVLNGKCRDACLQSECDRGEKALWVADRQTCFCFGQDECINGDRDCPGNMLCNNGKCEEPCQGVTCNKPGEEPVYKRNRGCACLGPNGCFDNADCGAGAVCENRKCNECPLGDRSCSAGTKCFDKRCRTACSAGECVGAGQVCTSGFCYDSWELER